ncbi:helix-turn-helix domain-containing protein [Shewanella indica]|uniref:Helix-turn-helix domain-containing protein n=1 Tax=Shewanella indica TaxID=768528 RepID=A0ABU4QGX5_9GAMM|nr:helix-turn-helix domain-containing protein [Shewanella indica]MDX6018601.1 helix-turn-helix domain-containing protein [Shewanella indica]MDX6018672.1 helix-turn-helix domain-containing protein [Shewanella indica]
MGEIVELPVPAQKLKALEHKWGKATLDVAGWTAIPNLLLERQQALGIDAVKLNILLVLLKHWWEKTKMPWPSKATIGEIVGRDKSTVQKHLKEMETRGLVKRKSRYQSAGGQTSNEYDLTGLITQLKALAKAELKEQKKRGEEDARKRRGHV